MGRRDHRFVTEREGALDARPTELESAHSSALYRAELGAGFGWSAPVPSGIDYAGTPSSPFPLSCTGHHYS